MKKTMIQLTLGILGSMIFVITLAVGVFDPDVLWAATNNAVGDIAGVDADLGNGTFELNTTTLAVVKTAFLTDGTQLTTGDNVPRGTTVQFLLYIDNTTAVPANDVSILDVLDPAFLYTAGTLRVDNSVATAGTVGAIRTAVLGTAALTDAVGDDVVSVTGTTVNIGNANEATNTQVNALGNFVYAVIFEVVMQ